MGIEIFFEDIEALSIQHNNIQKHIKRLIVSELGKVGDISLVFCSDVFLLQMNKQYLDHDYYTDIITFDYVEEKTISGDLFISVERVRENARELNVKFKKELYRVIFHGVLHLVGYKDKTEGEKKLMKEKEDFYLGEVDFREVEL